MKMFRYIYTSVYTPTAMATIGTPILYWMQFLKVAMVAEKYEIHSLKNIALSYLRTPGFEIELNVRHRVHLAITAATGLKARRTIDELIITLCDANFVDCYREADFRTMLQGCPYARDSLCEKHILQMVKVPEFITMLQRDGMLGARYIQYMAAHHERSHGRCAHTAPVVIVDEGQVREEGYLSDNDAIALGSEADIDPRLGGDRASELDYYPPSPLRPPPK